MKIEHQVHSQVRPSRRRSPRASCAGKSVVCAVSRTFQQSIREDGLGPISVMSEYQRTVFRVPESPLCR